MLRNLLITFGVILSSVSIDEKKSNLERCYELRKNISKAETLAKYIQSDFKDKVFNAYKAVAQTLKECEIETISEKFYFKNPENDDIVTGPVSLTVDEVTKILNAASIDNNSCIDFSLKIARNELKELKENMLSAFIILTNDEIKLEQEKSNALEEVKYRLESLQEYVENEERELVEITNFITRSLRRYNRRYIKILFKDRQILSVIVQKMVSRILFNQNNNEYFLIFNDKLEFSMPKGLDDDMLWIKVSGILKEIKSTYLYPETKDRK